MEEKTNEIVTNENKELVIKDFADNVYSLINDYESKGQLTMPADYNIGNAMKSAQLKLLATKDKEGHNALEVCEKRSIVNALLDMTIQGLNPASNQCYFIVRGKELTMMRSYFGTQLCLKRLPGIKDVWAKEVHKDDVFEISVEDGKTIVEKHETSFENIDKEIIGAYAVIEKTDGEKLYTVMTKKQIDQSWAKSSSTARTVHKEFPDEMVKRTVINRACKNFVNTCVGNDVLVESFNRTTSNEYENEQPKIDKEHKIIDFEEESVTNTQSNIPEGQMTIDDVEFD